MKANVKKAVENEEVNLFSQIWYKYFPYWPLFLILLALSIAGAWAYLRYKTKPHYIAKASILIKDEKKGQGDEKMIESLNQLATKKIIENETEVIKSRELMVQVVKRLHLYASVFQDGKTMPVSLYTNSPLKIQAQYPDSIATSGKVYFTLDTSKRVINFNNNSYALFEWVQTPWGKLKFIPTGKQPASNNPMYFAVSHPDNIASTYIWSLGVSPVSKLSSVINLEFVDDDPTRAEDILNELISAYNDASLNDKNTLAANTLVWVDERLNNVKQYLDSIEKRIQHYKSSQGAIDIGSQGTLYLETVSDLNQKLGDVNVQVEVLDKVEKYVLSKEKSGGIVPSTVGVTDPLLTQLLNKLYEKETEYEKLIKTTGEKNYLAVTLKDEIDKLRPSILENIRSQKTSLYSSRDNLNVLGNRYSSLLSSIPKKERDLVEISRQQSIMSNVYNFLLTKREETALALSASITDIRVIQAAKSFGPFTPARKTYAMAIVIALLVGIGSISGLELMRRTILFRHEIENYTSIPIIGEIAFEKSSGPLVIGEGKRTLVAEQFRSLRTSLPYIGINTVKKRLLVTSTIPGEGKSFIVANLGLSLAMTGKKVVVLECDLSNPSLGTKLEVSAEAGLADYLAGTAGKEDVIKPTAANENLFIIPAGKLPDNPSELIVSSKFPELLDYLSVFYDYMILDSPPVGFMSDAYVLSGYCDATLYVVRHRHTPKMSIKRIDENNKINELKNMAIVFNGVKSRGFGKYGYGYGYGYDYVYNGKGKKKKTYA